MMIPAPELSYGLAIGASGLLLGAAVAAASTERIVGRLGPIVRPEPSRPHSPKMPDHREDRAAGRGWPWGFRSYVAAHACGQVAGFVLGLRLAGPVGALAGAVGSSLGLESLLARRRARARERTDEQFRDVLTALAAGTRAGLSLRRARTADRNPSAGSGAQRSGSRVRSRSRRPPGRLRRAPVRDERERPGRVLPHGHGIGAPSCGTHAPGRGVSLASSYRSDRRGGMT